MANKRQQPASQAEEIRREIDETREELGETVGALAQKTDVKAQAKKKAAETQETVQARRAQVSERVRERPAVAGAVVGVAGGLFLLWRFARR